MITNATDFNFYDKIVFLRKLFAEQIMLPSHRAI